MREETNAAPTQEVIATSDGGESDQKPQQENAVRVKKPMRPDDAAQKQKVEELQEISASLCGVL